VPASASLNTVQAAILAALTGAAGSSWVTVPTITEGIPGDSIPTGGSTVRIYLQHGSAEPLGAGTSGVGHQISSRWHLWLVSTTPDGILGPRAVRDLWSGVLRVLFAAEGTLQAVANGGVWPMEYTYQDDLSRAGMSVGLLVVKAEYEQSHTDP
jgi:hypothetical protein